MFGPWAASLGAAVRLMLRFVLRRLVMLVATLLVSSFVIYSALYLAPGNPIATLTGGRTPSPEAIAVLEERYHLNEPFLVRYWEWLTGALTGDLGVSIPLRQERVRPDRASASARTLELVLYASVIIIFFGIGLGLLGGLRPGAVDTSVIVVTTISAALPAFVAAIVLIVGLRREPRLVPGARQRRGLPRPVRHLTLPAVALAPSRWRSSPGVTRAAVREELRREHVQTAISRGIPYAAGRAPARAAQRRDPDHDRRRHHDRVADRAGGGGRAGVQPQRPRRVPRAGRASKDFAVVQGISLVLVAAFVVTNTDRRPAVRVARPARRAREPGRMSVVAPPVPARAEPVDRRRGIPGLRGTGVDRPRRARRCSLLAVLSRSSGRSWRRTTRTQVRTQRRLRRPVRGPLPRVRRPGPRPALAPARRAPARRCSARCSSWRWRCGVGTVHRHRVRLARRRVRLQRSSAGLDVLFVFPGILLADPRRRGVRLGPDGGVDRPGLRVHPVRRPRAAQRVVARARPAVHRGPRGAGPSSTRICGAAPRAERRSPLIVAQGTHPVRLRRWSTSRPSRSSGSACSRRRPTGA